MGYKKLDEVMELLTDELDGFNKSIVRLEKLTQNVDDIRIRPDSSEIERLLRDHLEWERARHKSIQESVHHLGEQVSSARLVPKAQLWIQYSTWFICILIMGYLAFNVSRMDIVQENASAKGEERVLSSLKGYFDQYPDHYRSYQKWVRERDSVPNQK